MCCTEGGVLCARFPTLLTMCKIVKHGVVKNEQGETDIFYFLQFKIADHLFFATGIKYCTGTGLALIKISVFFLVDQLVKDQTRLFES